MNRTVMNRFALARSRARRARLTLTMTLAALALLSACAGGSGSPTTVNQVATAPTSSAADYTGPPPANADVQAFKLSFWQNVIPSNRCGGCHHAGGQSPAVRACRRREPGLSGGAAAGEPVTTRRSRRWCRRSAAATTAGSPIPSACGDDPRWCGSRAGSAAGASSTTSVTLVAPPVQAAGGGKTFPGERHGAASRAFPPRSSRS